MPQVEIFTPTGVVIGTTTRATVESDARGAPAPLPVDAGRWYPLDGGDPVRRGALVVSPDEMLVVVLAEPTVTIHAQWYPIAIDLGPYHVEGRLPTAPGFDPARALARPSGAFVALRDVSISLPGRPDGGAAERPHAHVNRYAVERVRTNQMLAYFFPGAAFEPTDELAGLPVSSPR
jgi:hypothetical protein